MTGVRWRCKDGGLPLMSSADHPGRPGAQADIAGCHEQLRRGTGWPSRGALRRVLRPAAAPTPCTTWACPAPCTGPAATSSGAGAPSARACARTDAGAWNNLGNILPADRRARRGGRRPSSAERRCSVATPRPRRPDQPGGCCAASRVLPCRAERARRDHRVEPGEMASLVYRAVAGVASTRARYVAGLLANSRATHSRRADAPAGPRATC